MKNPALAGFAIKIQQNPAPAPAGFEKSKSGTTLIFFVFSFYVFLCFLLYFVYDFIIKKYKIVLYS